jgi:hypothetical protein
MLNNVEWRRLATRLESFMLSNLHAGQKWVHDPLDRFRCWSSASHLLQVCGFKIFSLPCVIDMPSAIGR